MYSKIYGAIVRCDRLKKYICEIPYHKTSLVEGENFLKTEVESVVLVEVVFFVELLILSLSLRACVLEKVWRIT